MTGTVDLLAKQRSISTKYYHLMKERGKVGTIRTKADRNSLQVSTHLGLSGHDDILPFFLLCLLFFASLLLLVTHRTLSFVYTDKKKV
jgi:hypothetical protein